MNNSDKEMYLKMWSNLDDMAIESYKIAFSILDSLVFAVTVISVIIALSYKTNSSAICSVIIIFLVNIYRHVKRGSIHDGLRDDLKKHRDNYSKLLID